MTALRLAAIWGGWTLLGASCAVAWAAYVAGRLDVMVAALIVPVVPGYVSDRAWQAIGGWR